MNKKERSLLRFLLENESDFLPSQKIGSEVGLSDKTVRKYLNNLEKVLNENGAELLIKQGLGYQLEVKHPIQFDVFRQSLKENVRNLSDISRIEETSDRVYFILNKLCFENEEVSIKQLACDLYISKTTASNLISEVRTILKQYNLELANDGEQGMRLAGEERTIRHFIMDYFFTDKFGSSFSLVTDNQHSLAEQHYTEIALIVLDECRDAKVKLSDFIIRNLIMHILLMIKRIKNGFQIAPFDISPDIAQSIEYSVALNIIRRIEKVMQLEFPEEEAGFIALHLSANANRPQPTGDSSSQFSDLENELNQVLLVMEEETRIPFANDTALFNGLRTHCQTLLNRLKHRIHLKNPLLETIQIDYADTFKLTKKAFQEVSFLRGFEVSDDEWAYIALHITAAVERYKNKQKVRTLVVCATGVGSAQMLKTRLENEFGSYLNIMDVVSYYEITEDMLNRVDLIVSSIDLSHMILPIPMITVSVFLTDDDIKKIKRVISERNLVYKKPETKAINAANVSDDVFDRSFKEHQFLVYEQPIAKEELLVAMIQKLEEHQEPDFVGNFIKQIELRERFGSVVFNDHTALPHPTIPLNTTEQIVVAICKEGVQWDEENERVHFIFLVAPSKGTNQILKYVSKPIVEFIEDREAQQKLLKDASFATFKQHFMKLNTM